MHADPIIRPVKATEWEVVKRLVYTVAHPLMEPQMALDDLIRQWEEWGVLEDLNDIQSNYFDCRGTFLVVEENGVIVGTGAFKQYAEMGLFREGGPLKTAEESLKTGAGLCEIRRVTLLPEYRGKKLGYSMMQELIRRAREMGYTRAMLWTNPVKLKHAVDFYYRLGFTELVIEGIDPDEIWMGMEI